MRVFILCTGRCGSTTFINACRHITNFSSAHETNRDIVVEKRLSDQRFNYPDNHIEADNRLSWFLGDLDKRFTEKTLYVHLTRNKQDVASSYNKRWDNQGSIIKAFVTGILMTPIEELNEAQRLNACELYYDTVNTNIEYFLKDKKNKIKMSLETIKEDFVLFWKRIGAKGDIHSAISEFDIRYNSSLKLINSSGLREHNRTKVYGWISKTIAEVLGNDDIDEDSIMTFSLYLKFGVFKAYNPDSDTAKHMMESFYKKGMIEHIISKDELNSAFEDNNAILLDMYKQVWGNSYDKDMIWLKGWESICIDVLNGEPNKEQACSGLLKIISDRLGISYEISLIEQSMINKTIQLI